MILLDTNIISEMMRQTPDALAMAWLDQQDVSELFITTITIAEISYGLHTMPRGSRRERLEIAFNKAIVEAFEHRIHTFDEAAAHLYGKIMSSRKQRGKPLSLLDGQIAAIASAHNAILATRNIRNFIDCGLQLINPFASNR